MIINLVQGICNSDEISVEIECTPGSVWTSGTGASIITTNIVYILSILRSQVLQFSIYKYSTKNGTHVVGVKRFWNTGIENL